jgi:hypothetical protein
MVVQAIHAGARHDSFYNHVRVTLRTLFADWNWWKLSKSNQHNYSKIEDG